MKMMFLLKSLMNVKRKILVNISSLKNRKKVFLVYVNEKRKFILLTRSMTNVEIE